VVDVRDDAEIADDILRRGTWDIMLGHAHLTFSPHYS
jgi:hypothetical protein